MRFFGKSISPASLLLSLYLCRLDLCTHTLKLSDLKSPMVRLLPQCGLIILEKLSSTCLIGAVCALGLVPCRVSLYSHCLARRVIWPCPSHPLQPVYSHHHDLVLCNVSSLHQPKTSDPKSMRDFGFPIWPGDLLPIRSTRIKTFKIHNVLQLEKLEETSWAAYAAFLYFCSWLGLKKSKLTCTKNSTLYKIWK